MENVFPSREELKRKKSESKSDYQNHILDDIRSIDVHKVDFSKDNFKPRSEIVEGQKVYFWIRLYLNDEADVNPDDTIKITYIGTGESLDTKFICYSKKGLDKDSDGNIINYNAEDDKKVLCLMVDADKINDKDYNNDIPFIKTLFKTSRYYEYQLLKRDDLEFTNISNGDKFEYFDVTF